MENLLLECISNAINWDRDAAIENLNEYSSEELIEECQRFDIPCSSDDTKGELVAALVNASERLAKADSVPELRKTLEGCSREDLLDECRRLNITNVETEPTITAIDALIKVAGTYYEAVFVPSLDITLIVDHRHNEDKPLELVNYYYGAPQDIDTAHYAQAAKKPSATRIMVAIAREEHQQEITVRYIDSDTAAALVKLDSTDEYCMRLLLEAYAESHDQYVLGYAYTNDAADVQQLYETMEVHSNI